MMEAYTDPLTGQRLRRRSWGGTSHGRLFAKVNKRGGIDLYWAGQYCRNALDADLGKLLPKGGPIRLASGIYFLTRLPAGRYGIEPDQDGGERLFEVLAAGTRPRVHLMRPGQRLSTGNELSVHVHMRKRFNQPVVETTTMVAAQAKPARLQRPAA
jgi:hypothetical protein